MKIKILTMSSILCTSLVNANSLLIIGIGERGIEKVHRTKFKDVEKALLLANSEKKKLALELIEKNQDQSEWKLSKFSVGLGLKGEAGIGPWDLGLAIKQRIFYKRNN